MTSIETTTSITLFKRKEKGECTEDKEKKEKIRERRRWIYYNSKEKKYKNNTLISIYNNITPQQPYKINNINLSYSKNIKDLRLNVDETKPLFYKRKKTNDRLLAGFCGIKRCELSTKSKFYCEDENEYIFFREIYWHLTYHPAKENFPKKVRFHISIHDFNVPDYKAMINNNPFQLTFTFFDNIDELEKDVNIDEMNLFDIFKKILKRNINSIVKINNYNFNLVINLTTEEISLKIFNKQKKLTLYPYLTTNYPGNILTYQDKKYNLFGATITSDYHLYYDRPRLDYYESESKTFRINLLKLFTLIDDFYSNRDIILFNIIFCTFIDTQFVYNDKLDLFTL